MRMHSMLFGLMLLPAIASYSQSQQHIEFGVYGGHTIAGGAMLSPEFRLKVNRYPFAGVYMLLSLDDEFSLTNSIGYHREGYELFARAYGYNGLLSQQLQYFASTTSLRYKTGQFGIGAGLLFLYLKGAALTFDKGARRSNSDDFGKFKIFPSCTFDWSPLPRATLYVQFQGGMNMLQNDNFMRQFSTNNGDVVEYGAIELGLRYRLVRFSWKKREKPVRICPSCHRSYNL